MAEPQATPSETIQALQNQLQEAMSEAYQYQDRLTLAKEKINSIRTALNGVQLGQQYAAEQAEGPSDPDA